MSFLTVITIVAALLLFLLYKTAVIVSAREVGIKERLGQFKGVLKPGLHILIPFVDRVRYRHEMREQVVDIPMQSCITKDNIQVMVDGDVYFKVTDPYKASYNIANYKEAVAHLAMTTMRSEIGKLDLDVAFSERDTINTNVVCEIDEASDPWGVKVLRYEVETVQPSHSLIQTLEQQMEAERAKRAKILEANAERQSRTAQAEGERQEAINVSEGEKQRRINEAEGRAQAISIEAAATAEALELVAKTLDKPGGAAAMRLQVAEQFVEQLGKILANANVTIVPREIVGLKAMFEGMGQVMTNIEGGSARRTG